MAKDFYHRAVCQAIVKEGWQITHDPYQISWASTDLYIDLGAEMVAAELDSRKIAIEIKSFRGASAITELERALGQYILYRRALVKQDPDRELFLAMPVEPFDILFQTLDGRELIVSEKLRLVIFDPFIEEVVRWILPT
ncbi:MAG: element excision factor XisH family protein [Anaerolineae bacterium]|nr:element excision factor XisH family protein [Anaerolineae bacterium]